LDYLGAHRREEGRKNKGNGQKMTGRALFRAYQEDEGKARSNVIRAIERAAAKLNARSKA